MRLCLFLIASALAAWPSGASAFWQRSHWAACNEAPTEAERARLNCYIFAPVPDWPVDYALLDRRAVRLPPPPAPLPPRWRK